MLAYRWISIRQDVASMKIIPKVSQSEVGERWVKGWEGKMRRGPVG